MNLTQTIPALRFHVTAGQMLYRCGFSCQKTAHCQYEMGNIVWAMMVKSANPRRKQDVAVTFSGAVIVYKVSSAIAKRGKYEALFQ